MPIRYRKKCTPIMFDWIEDEWHSMTRQSFKDIIQKFKDHFELSNLELFYIMNDYSKNPKVCNRFVKFDELDTKVRDL